MLKRLLENYQKKKFQIEDYKLERSKIEDEIYEAHMPSCTSVLSDMPKGTETSDSTANSAIKIIEEKEKALSRTDKKISDLEKELSMIDSLIKTLKNKDQIIVHKRMREKKEWYQIYNEFVKEHGYDKKYSDPECIRQAYIRIEKELENTYNKGL